MPLDWALASLHHLAVFALFAVLVAELALLLQTLDANAARRLAALDLAYGIAAAAVVAAGVARVFLGDKGAAYYAGNALFWAKMATFVAIALLSIWPTLRFRAWARRSAVAPALAEVATLRRLVVAQLALFALLPVLAAGMARGFGS